MKFLLSRRSFRNSYVTVVRDYVDNNSAEKSDYIDKDHYESSEYKNIKITEIGILLFSVVSYIADLGSDVYLITLYYQQGHFGWFLLTLFFVLLPAIIMSAFSLQWYWLDNDTVISRTGWIIRFIFHFCGMAPLVRYTDTLLLAWKSKRETDLEKKKRYYYLMTYEEADSAMLRMMECSLEAGPQLLLQLYIILIESQTRLYMVLIQLSSSIVSLISLSWCLAAYHSSLRLITPGKDIMSAKSLTVMVIWKFFMIGPKFMSVALFTSFFGAYFVAILVAHFLLMLVYIVPQGTTFFTQKKFSYKEIIFNIVMAGIYCIDFINVVDGRSRWRYFFYYTLSFIELIIMVSLWLVIVPNGIEGIVYFNNTINNNNNTAKIDYKFFYYQNWPLPYRISVAAFLIFCFLIGIMVMIIYYLRYHPTQNIKIFGTKTSTNADKSLELTAKFSSLSRYDTSSTSYTNPT